MLEHFLRDDAAVQRMRASLLGAQLDSFAAVLSALGYARASIRDRLWTLAALGRWLKRRGLSATDLTRDAAAAFLRGRASRSRVHRGAAATLRLFFDHLEQEGLIPASPRHDPTPLQALQARYEAYLRDDSGAVAGDGASASVCASALSPRLLRRRSDRRTGADGR